MRATTGNRQRVTITKRHQGTDCFEIQYEDGRIETVSLVSLRIDDPKAFDEKFYR